MRRWWQRIRRAALMPPPGPDSDALATARQIALEAERALRDALDLEAEVTRRADHMERIHRKNNLGPSFWAAVEGRRA